MVSGGFVLGYVTTVHGVTETYMLILVAAAAALWIVTRWFAGIISDRIGRRPTCLIGYGFQLVWAVPMFLMIGPRQYVAHYLLGARLHDPNWTVLRTAIGNVFRNVAIAHPTVRRFHFVCHRRDLGRILRTHHGPVSCRYHRLDWFSWRVPGRHGHNFWRSGPDYQGAT